MVYRSSLILIVTILLVGCVFSELNSVPKEQKLETQTVSSSAAGNLNWSDILDDKLLFPLNLTVIPEVRQGEIRLKEMCDKSGKNDSYNKAKAAVHNIQACFKDLPVYAELPSKVEKSRPNGELDAVFKEYCQRSDEIKGCVNQFLVDVEPCLADNQKSSKYIIQNITEAILKFVCENEGDHIALFISEKGLECIVSKQPGIQKCIGSPNGTAFMADFENFSLVFELEQCRSAYQVRKCIVNELTTCSGSTPANVVDSVFNLIQNTTSCSKYTDAEIDPDGNNGAVSMFTSIFSLMVPLSTVLLVRYFNS